MGVVIGIDIGGSITKIIGFKDGVAMTPMMVKAADPIASLFGAFGKFIDANRLSLSDVEQVMITGVGATSITRPIYNIKTGRVAEFLANGLGGLYLSNLERALIVSMGTGTALVKAQGGEIEHIGGTGIGGGTILGLCKKMININDIDLIMEIAQNGNLSRVDLMVGDLTKADLPGLPPDTTASNLGKMSDIATQGDIALGVLNLVLQSIGTAACFATINTSLSDVVLIGNLSAISQAKAIFQKLDELFGVNFIIPTNSQYGTAFGAALAFKQGQKYEEI